MATRLFRRLVALCCIVGVVMLITSFAINPGPQANPTVAQLAAFGQQHYSTILIGAWLQAISPILIVLFALALVHLAGAANRLAGWMTMVGCIILILTSLIEVTFYISTLSASVSTAGLVSLDIIFAVQHLYAIVSAPGLFFPLAVVILTSGNGQVLPRIFGYLALVLGTAFTISGMAGLFLPIQDIVNVLAGIQGFWWLGAACTLFVQTLKATPSSTVALTATAAE